MREEGGHDVRLATVPPYQPPHVRARALWNIVEEARLETGAAKVNLVCHSLGGLDCRYLVSPSGLHWELPVDHADVVSAVASITTVATAHKGTPIADLALGYLPGADEDAAIGALSVLLGGGVSRDSIVSDDGLRGALAALSRSQAQAFNDEIIDAEGIYYQSWAGFSRPHGAPAPIHDQRLAEVCRADGEGSGLALFGGIHDYLATPLVPAYDLVGEAGQEPSGEARPNDGLCPVDAARWGRFRGCVPADHMEQLGRRKLPDANVRTGFDVARFYAEVAADLSRMGY
jgi:triacylglycerol lipase